MAKNARYAPDFRGTAKGLGSKDMQDAMVAITESKYLRGAILISPKGGSGNYANSFGVDRGMRDLGRPPTRRAAAILYNSAPYSGKVEQAYKVLSQIRAAIKRDNP